jgi:hypothetical protein
MFKHFNLKNNLKTIIMKRTLLLSAITIMGIFAVNAQTVWNFGSDATSFPVSAGIGAGPDVSKYVNGLGIHTGTVTNTNMGAVNASAKTFGTFSFTNRFQFNGAGYTGATDADVTPTVAGTNFFTPTQRYLTINVSGNSTIYAIGITGSAASSRKMFITNGISLIGTMAFPAGSAVNDATVNYTGPATKLYLFCNASCNLHYLSATNVVLTSVNQILADKGVIFNGTEIVNSKGLSLEVYSVLGKRVSSSKSTISTSNFQKGIYFVRAAGLNEALKITI